MKSSTIINSARIDQKIQEDKQAAADKRRDEIHTDMMSGLMRMLINTPDDVKLASANWRLELYAELPPSAATQPL